MDFNIIVCEDKINIMSILQSYVLSYNYTYFLLTRMGRTETIICKTFTGAASEKPSKRKLIIFILANVQKVKYKIW